MVPFFYSCGNVYSSLGTGDHSNTRYALLVHGPGPAMGWHFREPFFLCTHVSLCTLAAHRKKRNVCSLPRNAYSPYCSLSHPIDKVSMVFLVLQSVTTTISVLKVCVCLLAAVWVHSPVPGLPCIDDARSIQANCPSSAASMCGVLRSSTLHTHCR